MLVYQRVLVPGNITTSSPMHRHRKPPPLRWLRPNSRAGPSSARRSRRPTRHPKTGRSPSRSLGKWSPRPGGTPWWAPASNMAGKWGKRSIWWFFQIQTSIENGILDGSSPAMFDCWGKFRGWVFELVHHLHQFWWLHGTTQGTYETWGSWMGLWSTNWGIHSQHMAVE